MNTQSSPRFSISSFLKWLVLICTYGLFVIPIGLGCLLLWMGGILSWRNFKEKLGLWKWTPDAAEQQPHIWVHVSSVGEWRTVVPLLSHLQKQHPTTKIALTYFNEEMSRMTEDETFRSLIHVHAFMSLENPLATRRWIRRLEIRLLVLVEAEFWPLMLLTTHRLRVPIVLVSGVLFEREYARFIRLAWLMRPVWRTLKHFAVINETVAANFKRLGIAHDRITVTGSLKLDGDQKITELPAAQCEALTMCGNWLGEGKRFVIFLASVHFKEFQTLFPILESYFHSETYSFIVAPRLVREERGKFLRFFRQHKLSCVVRSELQGELPNETSYRHLFLDTLGEARYLMEQGHCVIVGGSFIPVGGHNVLEPLRLRVPTLVGPYHFHIEDGVRSFSDAVVACEISELEESLMNVRKRYGRKNTAAYQTYKQNLERQFSQLVGASNRTLPVLQEFL